MYAQILVNSLMLGLTYVLMASGLTIIFSILRLTNFAHGQFYVLGGYVIFLLSERIGVGPYIGLPLAVVFTGIAGFIIERLLIRPLRGQELPSFIVSLGILMLMNGIILFVFGETDRAVSPLVSGVLRVGTVSLSTERLLIIVMALAIIVALWLFVFRFRAGAALRAIAQDQDAAVLQGVNIDRMCGLTFGVGSLLAGVAGALLAPIFTVNPFVGHLPLFKAFTIIVLGGMGSIPGTIVAGLMLGTLENIAYWIAGGYTDLIGFVVIVGVLLLRPKGLMGHE